MTVVRSMFMIGRTYSLLRGRLNVSSRFLLVLLIGIAFQACLSVASLVIFKQLLLRDRTLEVKHLLETAYSTVAYYHAQVERGSLSDEAARKAAIAAVRAMHYDGRNYYFIFGLDKSVLAHGAHPEWEGKRYVDSPAARASPVIASMVARVVAVARSPAGEGIATYAIPKPGETIPIDKITYCRLFAPWGWVVGTGAYVDDINATFASQAWWVFWLFAGLIAVSSSISFVLGRDLAVALKALSARVAGVAAGEFDGQVPAIERTDEVGVMARALLVLRDNSREALALTLDALTGLPNRKLLRDRIAHAMALSERSGIFSGLMFIDLDRFKALNDSHGHDVGDMLLREIARRLRNCVRETDTVARLGGDEFVVVLGDIGTDEQDAAATLEAIGAKTLAVLKQPFHFGNGTHSGSGSIGLTLFRGDALSVEDVLKQADLAMYKAKEAGRNGCRFFDPIMEAVVRERAALESDLSRAISEQQFELYYQVQVGRSGAVKGAEALIRWNHPRRGVVPPIDFIPLAEETGLILPLGAWVLRTACRQLVSWSAVPETANLTLAVNVSSRQFQQPDFVEQVVEAIRDSGADPRRLHLELTESLFIDDVDAVIDKMLALRECGVSFTLDDFGTGYSSLLYLKRMPLTALKIDRTFVRDLLFDPNDAAIARTIVALAHSLGLGVVAEGVESFEQRDFLAECGCDDYQGYVYSQPLPLAAFEGMLRGTVAVAGASAPQLVR